MFLRNELRHPKTFIQEIDELGKDDAAEIISMYLNEIHDIVEKERKLLEKGKTLVMEDQIRLEIINAKVLLLWGDISEEEFSKLMKGMRSRYMNL